MKARARASRLKEKSQYPPIRLLLEAKEPCEEVTLSELIAIERDLLCMALSESQRNRNWFNKRPLIKAGLAALNAFFEKMTSDDVRVLISTLPGGNNPSTPILDQIKMIKEHYANLLENAAFNVNFHNYISQKFPRRVKIYKLIESRYPRHTFAKVFV